MSRTLVTATLTAPGLHNWETAPRGRSYLSYPHRHLFTFTATVKVTHDDRDVEYHDLRDHIDAWLNGFPRYRQDTRKFGGRSCEHLARDLWTDLREKGLPVVRVTCSEDNEFTSTIEETP